MSEIEKIVETIEEWSRRGIDFALATVVGTRGSTYRGLGARQLVASDGTSIGTVSGGCLDRDVEALAMQVMANDKATVASFDLTADDEAVWGWGIGCNGVTELLVETAASARALAASIRPTLVSSRYSAIVHEVDTEVPTRVVVGAGEDLSHLGSRLAGAVATALDEGRDRVEKSQSGRVLIEIAGAPTRLLVFGAGHDAVPLVELALRLGLRVVVADERRQFLSHERFPGDVELLATDSGSLAEAAGVDHRTFAVIMSHNYLRDLESLRSLLGTEVAYIGALGPAERLRRLLKDLEASGSPASDSDRDKLYAPAGLDIGAEGPVEIAWSVLSEVLAVRRSRPGSHLRSDRTL